MEGNKSSGLPEQDKWTFVFCVEQWVGFVGQRMGRGGHVCFLSGRQVGNWKCVMVYSLCLGGKCELVAVCVCTPPQMSGCCQGGMEWNKQITHNVDTEYHCIHFTCLCTFT